MMDQVIAARAQMGTSLGFHIVFASLGIGLPLLVFIAEGVWLRTGNRAYYNLARTWAKGLAILFAVGAVSGTILAFELGLLWPGFMGYAGAIIGMPFSFEGFAFFIEAIFIGLYLYGWDRLSPRAHWLCAVPIAIAGPASAMFVTMANAWMNMPTGFRLEGSKIVDVHPFEAMFAKPWLIEVIHASLAAYVFVGFGVAGVCALALLRNRMPEKRDQIVAGLRIALAMAVISIPLQVIAGDFIARFDAAEEPAKFASLEALEHTQRGAPIEIGGLLYHGKLIGAIELPKMLSILVAFNPNAEIKGLDQIPPEDRPPVELVHLSFDSMVGTGTLLLLIAVVAVVAAARRRLENRRLLALLVLSAPLGLIALEAGWCVTEFGRQPWIARGLLRTTDAATQAPGVLPEFYLFSLVYVGLGALCWWLLRRLGRHA